MKLLINIIIFLFIGLSISLSNKNESNEIFNDKNYLISKSNEIDLSNYEQQLNRKSKEFLRYSRNEIFARHGYRFKDNSLNTFFSNMPWYKPTESNSLIEINQLEKNNVSLLKKIENESIEDSNKILYHYIFNDKLLIYFAYDFLPQDEQDLDMLWYYPSPKWESGEFILLDSNLDWLELCQNIPIEFLTKNAYSRFEQSDIAMQKADIIIKDIDEGCKNSNGNELLVYYRLDQYYMIYGIKENKINYYCYIHGTGLANTYLSENEQLIKTERMRGHPYCLVYIQEYIFNSETKNVKMVNTFKYEIVKYSKGPFEYTGEERVIYDSIESAKYRDDNKSIGTLNKNSKAKFHNLYFDGSIDLVEIEVDSIIGWVEFSDVYKSGVFFGMPAID